MLTFSLTLWGDVFHEKIGNEELHELISTLRARFDAIQVLRGEAGYISAWIGEERTDPNLLEVTVAAEGVPVRSSKLAEVIVPGVNDDIPRALRENTRVAVERFCEKHGCGNPELKFNF
ncbi:MAG: hypothetical protein AAB669_02485 [Patescibacteria group bacterium]